MPSSIDKLIHLMRLTRIEFVITAVADVWLIAMLGRYVEPIGRGGAHAAALREMPLWLVLMLTAVIASGLATYGLALNDVLDVRRDRAFSPKRPLPAGSLSLRTALSIALLGLLAALSAAVVLGQGSALLCGVTAGAILFYNTTARFLPAVGVITFALIRMLNMFIPNPELGFAWPIWMNLTVITVTATVAYVIIAKRPRLEGGHFTVICASWAFWTLALIGWMTWRDTLFVEPYPYIWLGPLMIFTAFFVYLSVTMPGKINNLRRRRQTGNELIIAVGHGLILLNASWLLAAGMLWQACIIALLFVLAVALTRLLTFHQQLSDVPARRRQRKAAHPTLTAPPHKHKDARP